MLQRAESLSARSLARAWCDTVDVEVSGLVVTQHLRGEQLYSRCLRPDGHRAGLGPMRRESRGPGGRAGGGSADPLPRPQRL